MKTRPWLRPAAAYRQDLQAALLVYCKSRALQSYIISQLLNIKTSFSLLVTKRNVADNRLSTHRLE